MLPAGVPRGLPVREHETWLEERVPDSEEESEGFTIVGVDQVGNHGETTRRWAMISHPGPLVRSSSGKGESLHTGH